MSSRRPGAHPRRALLSLALLSLASACDRRPTGHHGSTGPHAGGSDRCAFCGMRAPESSHWRAGATDARGEPRVFCAPACLFRYLHRHGQSALQNPWVTEYYGPASARTDARQVRYAVGSDLVGPMGPDLVPVAEARVVAFTSDHRPARVVTFDEVTPAVITALSHP